MRDSFAARSRLDPRESLRDEASSRPRRPAGFEDLAAALLEALDAACAEGAAMKKIVEITNAVRLRERNFRVIELFLA
ncbi:MAG: hypothetical protein DMF67_17430 [Acidobacteria bacterium]|nr:MAG: hypothetical protein DMF67_17430 [Acidobacteriota bacterium]